MTLQLKTFGPAFGELDASPFCAKAIYLLNMAGVPWTLLPGSDSRKTPVGKLPVLLDGNTVIHDSDNIRYHLEEHYAADFDPGLSDRQKSQSRALIRMTEEHLYFCLVYDRWVDDASWTHVRDRFFASLPPLIRTVIPKLVRRDVLSSLKGQGIGRIPYDEMYSRAHLDICAIETLVAGDQFLFGDLPTAADVSVSCMLSCLSANLERTKLSARVLDSERLMRYINDVRSSIYPADTPLGSTTDI